MLHGGGGANSNHRLNFFTDLQNLLYRLGIRHGSIYPDLDGITLDIKPEATFFEPLHAFPSG